MSVEQLLLELKHLNRGDKIRAMQVLITELAQEENMLILPDATYEVWSPFDSADAAMDLNKLLDANREKQNE